jgi:phospholipase/carboxylesterase
MPPTTEMIQSQTGLIYRVRRGQPQDGLIVMLHGLSGDENVMWIFDHALPRSATVIAPRALYASEFGGYSWARSVVRDDLDDVDFQAAIEQLAPFINEAIASYQVDPQRVILMGFSQGAALSYAYSLAQPGTVRGVIALAGFLPQRDLHSAWRAPALRTGRERGRPAAESKNVLPHYLIIHGTHDEAVPIDRAREARSVLEGRGAVVEYHEHRVGHKVAAQGMKEIARWIEQILR